MESVTFSSTPLAAKLPKIHPTSKPSSLKSTQPPSKVRQSPPFMGLTGPTYSISSSTEKFKLPPPSSLQPGQEHSPGKLESWPVHSLNPSKSNFSLAQSAQIVSEQQSSPTHKKELISVMPKPKFLEQLESYLLKELRFLGCPSCGPHELRLQAHREVFEYLIEDFKTYKPLLSAIKNEYELFIEYQQNVIKELEPLEANLEKTKDECDRKIMTLREKGKQGDAAVLKDNQKLSKTVRDTKNQELAYKSQIERLQAQVEELYEKHRYEADARKLLISDYNDLKFRQEEQKGEESVGQEEREDPVLLKLKLARAREDLRASNQRINTMLADYGDVVPRREFEMVETSYKTLETETDALKNDHGVLMVEHSTLQSVHKDTLNQTEELQEELSQLKRSATPRPDWNRCATYVDKWEELSAGRSTGRKVDVLLACIAGVDVSEITEEDTLQGQGRDDTVPKYLRYEGTVKNRHISRGDVNSLISGFWHHRITSESQQQQSQLDECLYEFLLSRNNGDENIAFEDGYNLEEALSRLAHEPHIALFAGIVHGELSESVFHDWLTTQTLLTEAFHNQQTEQNLITEETLKQVLISQLKGHSEEQVQALLNTATKLAQTQPGTIDYIKLLSPDSESGPSEFVVLLLEQERKASKLFVSEVLQAFSGNSEVSLSDLNNVLNKLDPNQPTADLHALYSQVYSLPVEQVTSSEAQCVTISKTHLMEKLSYSGIKRTG